jgi:hypothetical protein
MLGGWLKTQKRRLEQGILESIKMTSSSKDESVERDQTRYKRLDESINKLNTAALTYINSLRRSCDDARDLAACLENIMVGDIKAGITARSPEALHVIDGISGVGRYHASLKLSALRAIEKMLMERVVSPAGGLIRQLPVLKKLLDTRY